MWESPRALDRRLLLGYLERFPTSIIGNTTCVTARGFDVQSICRTFEKMVYRPLLLSQGVD